MRWFEEYEGCGCVSDIAVRKMDLLGYCAVHGGYRRHAFPVPPGEVWEGAHFDRQGKLTPRRRELFESLFEMKEE